MTAKFVRNRATWMAYILMALYGYFLNVLGPITPFLHDEFHLSYIVSSLHFSAFAVGILVVGLGGHVVINRTGRVRALSIGAAGLGLGALLLVLGRAPVVTVGAAFLMGCVGSLILAVVPPVLAHEHGEMGAVAISEANVLSSVLAAIAPILVGWLAGLLVGWRLALVVAAVVSILIGAVLFWQGQASENQAQANRPKNDLPVRQSGPGLPRVFWFYWITLVLAVAIEFCTIYWSADYMMSALGLAQARAAQSVSLFLVGMITGRLVSSRVLRYLSARSVVLISIGLGILGFLFFWTTTSVGVGMVGLTVMGLGVAGLYPLILSMAIGAAKGREDQAGARATLASGTAILILPLVLGRLADLAGLKIAFTVIAVLFVAMMGMMMIRRT